MIRFKGVSKRFGENILFNNLDFQVLSKSVVCLIGPSGCGKTTILNMVAGLLQPDSGKVIVSGRVSYDFQDARLLPWMTVKENVMYAMGSQRSKKDCIERADELLEQMELHNAAQLLPRQISGGMARRAALARALLAPYDLILLDEPLASLDPDMRSRIVKLMPSLLDGKTVVLVTHDYATASALSDRVFYLSSPPVSLTEVKKNDIEGTLKQIENIDCEC